MNHHDRSTYEKYLQSLLQMNDLPSIKLGNIELPVTDLSSMMRMADDKVRVNFSDLNKSQVKEQDILIDNSDESSSCESEMNAENSSPGVNEASKHQYKSSKKGKKGNSTTKKATKAIGSYLTLVRIMILLWQLLFPNFLN